MIHSHEPLPFKAGARFALSPNAAEVPVLSGSPEVQPHVNASLGAQARRIAGRRWNLDWQAFVHAILLGIRKSRLRGSTKYFPDVTEPQQSGTKSAKLGMEIKVGA